MTELILIITSISIMIFITITSNKSKKEKTFGEILEENKMLEKDKLLYELKRRNFIDKVLHEYSDLKENSNAIKEQIEIKDCIDNQKLIMFKEMLKDSKSEIEICKKLDIGRGEFLLLTNLYKKQILK